ncbi:unnamed protein product [Symbiodinium sp. CCMP2592]|nr:unnamed protein product [Symbiodinium sp. CCMP2592]
MAGPGIRIPLPGGVPEGPDEDLDGSPQKRPKGADTNVAGQPELTMQSIKDLLAGALREQSHSLLQAQQMQITTSLQAFEERQGGRLDKLEEHVMSQSTKVDDLETRMREMSDRLAKVEARPGSTGSGGPDRRNTLVFGGWSPNTRRGTLLEQLRQAIHSLGVAGLMDAEPFCTGARRSVALCVFKRRPSEGDDEPRSRMLRIMQVVNAGQVQIEGAVKPLWASFSKSPEERGRAAVAAVVRKIVLKFAPQRIQDLDVEYTSGRTWIRDDQLSGLGDPVPEVRRSRVVTTKAGPGWIDEATLSKWVEVDLAEQPQQSHAQNSLGDFGKLLSVWGWNVGGAELSVLPKAVRSSAERPLQKDDLLLLQEVPRERQGWNHQELAGRRVISHRAEHQWRGTGLWYDAGSWCVLRRLCTGRGTWFKVRHLCQPLELWVGTAHFSPGVSVASYEDEVHEFFGALPRSAHKVVFQGDVNCAFGWTANHDGVGEIAKEGKSHIVHQAFVERGLAMIPPSAEQLNTPTSRPRQQDRQGQCIDVMVSSHMHAAGWHIHEGSYLHIGTDHELCEGRFFFERQREYARHETRPRHYTGGLQIVEGLDQDIMEGFARQYTKPIPGRGYRDSPEIRKAFRDAKRSGSAVQWKRALKLRRESRRQWEWNRLVRASEGEWHSFRALKPRRHAGWDIGFAEAQTGDPHQAVHAHLSEVYKGPPAPAPAEAWRGEVRAFSMEELKLGVQQMKRGKAVGADLTSTELILGIMEVQGGAEHLLEWYNRILVTGVIPQKWNEPVLVMLPKIQMPKKAKDLRPIAMGSSVSKLFSRLLLNRALPAISPQTYAQCSGPGRQTSDFLYTIMRLFDLTREWGNTLAVFKLDLEKAFDSLDRSVLLDKLEAKLGQGLLQTPWGCSRIEMNRGIKQGAVESPTFFAYVAELALVEALELHGWRNLTPLFPDLPPEEMQYMDDGMLWNGNLRTVEARAQQLSVSFARYGLRMNPAKCQLYVTPNMPGEHCILLNGIKVTASPQLEVMGISMRVGMSTYELVAPASTRARAKFWELKHIFRAKGYMKHRATVLQRVVGATALWFICCVPPDKATMTALNATQLQLMIWLLRFAKTRHESWEDFRKRAFRGARSALHAAGLERWSTLWLRRYWQYAGHRVRASLSPVPPISSEFEHFRTHPWWLHQQTRPRGLQVRHKGHHYARLTVLEKNMDAVAGHPWRVLAHNRGAWKGRENAWVAHMDVPWSSGRQLAIGDQ